MRKKSIILILGIVWFGVILVCPLLPKFLSTGAEKQVLCDSEKDGRESLLGWVYHELESSLISIDNNSPYHYYKGVIYFDCSPLPITTKKSSFQEIMSSAYAYDNKNIYYEGKLLAPKGESTPELLTDAKVSYFLADNKLYRTDKELKNIDTDSFSPLGQNYYQDKDHVYISDMIVSGADSISFEEISMYFAKDENNVYAGFKWEIVSGADATSFRRASIAHDSLAICKTTSVINTRAWRMFSPYAQDNNNLYYWGSSGKLVISPKVDGKKIYVLPDESCQPSEYATDGERVYQEGELIWWVNFKDYLMGE